MEKAFKVNDWKRGNPEKLIGQIEKVLDRYFPDRGCTISKAMVDDDYANNQFTMIIKNHEKNSS